MSLLVSLVLMVAAGVALVRLPPARRGQPDGRRRLLVAAVLLLPLLYASLVLWGSRERLKALDLTYVGKRVAYGEGGPVTFGGADRDAEDVEDLHTSILEPGVGEIAPATEEEAEILEGVEPGDPLLHLRAPAPVVRVGGRLLNRVTLQEGDALVLEPRRGDPVELRLEGGDVVGPEGRFELPGMLERLFQGAGRVIYLPQVIAAAAGEVSGDFRSILFRPKASGPWHLVLRDATVTVRRGGETVARFGETFPAFDVEEGWRGEPIDLQLQVAMGRRGVYRFRTVRQDTIVLRPREGYGEIRFGEVQRRRVPLGGEEQPLELGLVVPSTIDRRERLIELEERSARFRGLAATLKIDPQGGRARLQYLGGEVVADAGELYAIGEGENRLLLRLERNRFPARVLFDLLLLAIFLWSFLGPALERSTALVALVGPTTLLLADRLLFSHRAAVNPPDFLGRAYGEARLALWLVPALILLGWTVAVALRHPPPAGEDASRWQRLRHGAGRLRWPLLGLATAGFAAAFSTSGLGNLRWLGLLPFLLAAALLLFHGWAATRGGERLQRWHGEGFRWRYRWLWITGGAILLLRFLATLIGMPEALRIPAFGFRALWTVFQLPIAAVAVALTCQLVMERRDQLLHGTAAEAGGGTQVLRHWLMGVVTLGGFLGLAFAAVALIADDVGLLLVHSLPTIFALALLLPGIGILMRRLGSGKRAVGWIAGSALAVLPLLLVLWANAAPGQVMGVVDRLQGLTGEETPVDPDPAARLRATSAQQLFRLHLLANPGVLREVGVIPAERVAIQYDTFQGYAAEAGAIGGGYGSSDLPRNLGVTYLNDLMPMAFVLADFGKVGMLALALLYLSLAAVVVLVFRRRRSGDRLGEQGAWITLLAVAVVVLPSLYMILANLNLVLFTGKNCALLALNSVSDVLESAAVLGVAAFGIGLERGKE